mmetsp:Transcript_16652/g.41207  ORF Transcript_16652/g.41207 Transcript_16652/m.41207 type:complete len:493 (+) Transcript_16652:1830-3308(+)
MARARHKSTKSSRRNVSTPSNRTSRSSNRSRFMWCRSRSASVERKREDSSRPRMSAMMRSFCSGRLSNVNHLPKSREKRITSFAVGNSCLSSFAWKFLNSVCASSSVNPSSVWLACCRIFDFVVSSTTSWKKTASSFFTFSVFFMFSDSSPFSRKVDGIRFGKKYSTGGRNTSAKGTMMNTENGISLPMSAMVRTRSLRSRYVSTSPFSRRRISRFASFKFTQNKPKPCLFHSTKWCTACFVFAHHTFTTAGFLARVSAPFPTTAAYRFVAAHADTQAGVAFSRRPANVSITSSGERYFRRSFRACCRRSDEYAYITAPEGVGREPFEAFRFGLPPFVEGVDAMWSPEEDAAVGVSDTDAEPFLPGAEAAVALVWCSSPLVPLELLPRPAGGVTAARTCPFVGAACPVPLAASPFRSFRPVSCDNLNRSSSPAAGLAAFASFFALADDADEGVLVVEPKYLLLLPARPACCCKQFIAYFSFCTAHVGHGPTR